MGDYFKQTFKKCVDGIAWAALTRRPVSAPTKENCEVAVQIAHARAAKKVAEPEPKEKKTQPHHRDAKKLRKLTAPIKPRSYEFFREIKPRCDDFLEKSLLDLLKDPTFWKSLKNKKPEEREQILKQVRPNRFFQLEELQGGELI